MVGNHEESSSRKVLDEERPQQQQQLQPISHPPAMGVALRGGKDHLA
jgi:hypothetical protein